MTPPKTVVPGPTDSCRLAEPVHCGRRFRRFPDFFVDPTPPLPTMGRACSRKRRKTFLKSRSPSPVVRLCVPAREFVAHPLSVGIVQHARETPAVPLGRATHLARSPAVLGFSPSPPFPPLCTNPPTVTSSHDHKGMEQGSRPQRFSVFHPEGIQFRPILPLGVPPCDSQRLCPS